MTTPERDQARLDLVHYHKSLIANRTESALEIEQRYGLDGYPPQLVSIGLQAAAEGRCAHDAVGDYMEARDE